MHCSTTAIIIKKNVLTDKVPYYFSALGTDYFKKKIRYLPLSFFFNVVPRRLEIAL